jgi:hypothetical protein
MEAAVLSGLQAAKTILDKPLMDGVLGSWYPMGAADDDAHNASSHTGTAATTRPARRRSRDGAESGPGAGAESDSLRPFDPLRAVSDVQTSRPSTNAGRIIGRYST